MGDLWDMYQDLLVMYGTKEELETEIVKTMADTQIILHDENSTKIHDRFEAIFYLHLKIFNPIWRDLQLHPPPRSAKKSWL